MRDGGGDAGGDARGIERVEGRGVGESEAEGEGGVGEAGWVRFWRRGEVQGEGKRECLRAVDWDSESRWRAWRLCWLGGCGWREGGEE